MSWACLGVRSAGAAGEEVTLRREGATGLSLAHRPEWQLAFQSQLPLTFHSPPLAGALVPQAALHPGHLGPPAQALSGRWWVSFSLTLPSLSCSVCLMVNDFCSSSVPLCFSLSVLPVSSFLPASLCLLLSFSLSLSLSLTLSPSSSLSPFLCVPWSLSACLSLAHA